MSIDPTEFDPYHKWLGIPPSDQPANHYRLLGLALYESDPDVIAAAADRQMAHVKSFAAGRYAAHSQLLLNELSKARVCLLNPNLKPIYDAQLTKLREKDREELIAVVQNVQPVTPPQDREAVVEAPAPKPSDSVQALESLAVPIRSTVRRKRRRSPMLLNFFIILAGGIVVAGLLWYAKVTGPPVGEANVSQGSNAVLDGQPIQESDPEDRRIKGSDD